MWVHIPSHMDPVMKIEMLGTFPRDPLERKTVDQLFVKFDIWNLPYNFWRVTKSQPPKVTRFRKGKDEWDWRVAPPFQKMLRKSSVQGPEKL